VSNTGLRCLLYSSSESEAIEILSIKTMQYFFTICSLKASTTILMNYARVVEIPYGTTDHSDSPSDLTKAIFLLLSEATLSW
jgi:hypothetical protein